MSDTLVEFARRLESDVDPMAAVSVVEAAATERRAAFETALDTVVSELFGADPAARRASARMLYRLSEEVPGTLVTRGTELVPALDNDALRPYIAGTLTNTVYEGMRG